MKTYSVTIEAFGHVRTKRFQAETEAEAVRKAKLDIRFRVSASEVGEERAR